MRRMIIALALAVGATFAGCEHLEIPSENGNADVKETKNITFAVRGGFSQTFTRATTAVGETSMTDLWVLDYVDGELVQQVKQASTDEDFGSPTLSLTLGSHEIYFVASAGGSPVLNTDGHKITWGVPRDTFWKKLSLGVSASTGGNQSVTLERVATRLSVNIEDALPAELAKIEIQPQTWYYGVDYLTGGGTDAKSEAFTINIPASYAGRTNTMVAVFGMSMADEFTTDVTIRAKDGDGGTITSEVIDDAPMQRNRSTDYTGTLFLSENVYGVSVDDTWGTAYQGTW